MQLLQTASQQQRKHEWRNYLICNTCFKQHYRASSLSTQRDWFKNSNFMFCIHRSVKFLDLLLKLITSCFYLFVHSKCTKFVSSPLTIQHANTTRPYMIRVLQEVDQVLTVFVFHLNWFELIYRCSKIEFILFRFIATATKIYFVNKSFR